MFSNNNFISLRQLQVLLILDIFGMGITILPRRVTEIAGQDGWFLIIVGLIFALICVGIINKVARLYPNDNFVEYSCKILGKPLGILVSIGFIIKIILNVAFDIRIFGEIIKEEILSNTPFWVIALIILIIGSYAASKGFEVRGRISEILCFVVFIPLIFVFLIAIFEIDFTNLKPVFQNINIKNSLQGGYYTFFYFSGIEFLLLSYPYLKEKKKVMKATLSATALIGIIILIISTLTIARFGKNDIVHQMWPVLEIMDTIDLPGSFIERQDALIMSFWIISIFMIINSGMFFSSLIFKNIVNKGKHSIYIVICLFIIFAISFFPKNISEIYKYMDLVYMIFGTCYLFIIPLVMLIVAKIRGLGEKI